MKNCNMCKQQKELSEFYKNRKNSDGLYPACKDCWKAYVSTPERKIKRNISAVKNGVHTRRYSYHREVHLKKKYGITPAQYQEMLSLQEGKCAICDKDQSDCKNGLCVDHDHSTGKVRKLLCRECNAGLGQFRESKKIISKALNYLETYS